MHDGQGLQKEENDEEDDEISFADARGEHAGEVNSCGAPYDFLVSLEKSRRMNSPVLFFSGLSA